MSRLAPLNDADIPEAAKPMFDMAQQMMGFTPNDGLIMARNPTILEGVSAMCAAIYAPGEIGAGLKRLIGYIASTAAGCKYCQSHTAHGALSNGVDAEKLKTAWAYESSALFSQAERAALKVAQAGAMSPCEVTDAMFADLKSHFSDAQIVEIMAVISMFGFLNRWNAMLDTQIEELPAQITRAVNIKL